MSTKIINFEPTSNGSTKSRVELVALQLYLAISLPLVCHPPGVVWLLLVGGQEGEDEAGKTRP
jgi:hypothetical protein